VQWYEIAKAHREAEAELDAEAQPFSFGADVSSEVRAVDFGGGLGAPGARYSASGLAGGSESSRLDREAAHAAELEAAHHEGSEQGRREAEAAAAEERDALVAQLDQQLCQAILQLGQSRRASRVEAAEIAISLARTFATHLMKSELKRDPEAYRHIAMACLEGSVGLSNVTVTLPTDGYRALRDQVDDISAELGANVDLREDESLPAGSCVVDSERGRVQSDPEQRLARLADIASMHLTGQPTSDLPAIPARSANLAPSDEAVAA